MGRITPHVIIIFLLLLSPSAIADAPKDPFTQSFIVMGSEEHVRTSKDGQIWSLSLYNKTGGGFQTRERYRFGWFSMKLKLSGGDSAGVVTAYYMCSETGAGPERDELDMEFLGNRTEEPYLIQTNVYKNGTGNREMRHALWFDPSADFHAYSILWNNHQIVFFVDDVPIRVHKNNNKEEENGFFPNGKPMYLFSSIWNADDWATRGGLEKTDWSKAPFVSSYTGFTADGCMWEEPFPNCVSTTGKHWWDQEAAWTLTSTQMMDYSWAQRNFAVYDYCRDLHRFQSIPPEC